MNSGPSVSVYIAVGIGGMAGGVVRMLVSNVWPLAAGGFPSGLLVVNAVGSALIGLVFAFSESGGRFRLPPALSLGLMAGFCGALTTFSTFSVESLNLMHKPALAAWNVVVSLFFWLAAAALGLFAGRRLNAPKQPPTAGEHDAD